MGGRDIPTARKKYWGLPVPSHLQHGPNTWAKLVYGCACQACLPSGKRTWRTTEGAKGPISGTERRKRSRKKLRGQPVPPGTRHGLYAAQVYRCKCEICSAALRRAKHKSKNPWMYRDTRGHWGSSTDQAGAPVDTIWWPPDDSDLTDCPHETCHHPTHKEVT